MLAEDASATTEEALPRIDELVPGVTTEVPNLDDLVQPQERPYPNAGDILRAMREIPPLERSRDDVVPAPPPEAEGDAGTGGSAGS